MTEWNASPSDATRQPLEGSVFVLFSFDIGFQIDLDRAAEMVQDSSRRNIVRSRRPAPAWFDYEPLPLCLVLNGESITVAGIRSDAAVEALVYDFGAALLTYRIPLPEFMESLPDLSAILLDNAELEADARSRVSALHGAIEGAIEKPQIKDAVEDYVVFSITRWDSGVPVSDFFSRHREVIARAIESSPDQLAEEQIDRSTEGRLSYGSNDMAIIDWNAAVLLDSAPEDILTVLQHANVELLALRVLDAELDSIVDNADEILGDFLKKRIWPTFSASRLMGQFSAVQTDAAVSFEGLHNAIKLFGNQYLALVYRLTAKRLDLNSWQASVQRKLTVAESIYQRMYDATSVGRLETLEWVIIVLIAISMALPFLPWYGH